MRSFIFSFVEEGMLKKAIVKSNIVDNNELFTIMSIEGECNGIFKGHFPYNIGNVVYKEDLLNWYRNDSLVINCIEDDNSANVQTEYKKNIDAIQLFCKRSSASNARNFYCDATNLLKNNTFDDLYSRFEELYIYIYKLDITTLIGVRTFADVTFNISDSILNYQGVCYYRIAGVSYDEEWNRKEEFINEFGFIEFVFAIPTLFYYTEENNSKFLDIPMKIFTSSDFDTIEDIKFIQSDGTILIDSSVKNTEEVKMLLNEDVEYIDPNIQYNEENNINSIGNIGYFIINGEINIKGVLDWNRNKYFFEDGGKYFTYLPEREYMIMAYNGTLSNSNKISCTLLRLALSGNSGKYESHYLQNDLSYSVNWYSGVPQGANMPTVGLCRAKENVQSIANQNSSTFLFFKKNNASGIFNKVIVSGCLSSFYSNNYGKISVSDTAGLKNMFMAYQTNYVEVLLDDLVMDVDAGSAENNEMLYAGFYQFSLGGTIILDKDINYGDWTKILTTNVSNGKIKTNGNTYITSYVDALAAKGWICVE